MARSAYSATLGGHDSENSVCGGDDGITGTTVLGGEELGGDSVGYTTHGVGCETVAAVPAQQGIGRTCNGIAKEEDTGQD